MDSTNDSLLYLCTRREQAQIAHQLRQIPAEAAFGNYFH